jgi:dienelactone hydrolase
VHKRFGGGLVAVLVGAAAAVPLGLGAPATAAAPKVTLTHVTLTDDSRPTAATAAEPATDSRVLETTMAYPARGKKKLPLVVLAHGYNGNPDKFTQLITAWAGAGYVVAAPRFPLTNDLTSLNGPPGDVANQPADVSFVIDQMLRMNKQAGALRGRIDRKRIGLAGLSLGGWTSYGILFNSCCRDDRIDAAILMSALRGDFAGGQYDYRSIPVLLEQAEADAFYPHSRDTYPLLAGPKWFATLHGGTTLRHATPFEDTPDPADDLVRESTTAFWDLYLKHRTAAERRLQSALEPADGSVTLQHEA